MESDAPPWFPQDTPMSPGHGGDPQRKAAGVRPHQVVNPTFNYQPPCQLSAPWPVTGVVVVHQPDRKARSLSAEPDTAREVGVLDPGLDPGPGLPPGMTVPAGPGCSHPDTDMAVFGDGSQLSLLFSESSRESPLWGTTRAESLESDRTLLQPAPAVTISCRPSTSSS